jgi:hypothetical protein
MGILLGTRNWNTRHMSKTQAVSMECVTTIFFSIYNLQFLDRIKHHCCQWEWCPVVIHVWCSGTFVIWTNSAPPSAVMGGKTDITGGQTHSNGWTDRWSSRGMMVLSWNWRTSWCALTSWRGVILSRHVRTSERVSCDIWSIYGLLQVYINNTDTRTLLSICNFILCHIHDGEIIPDTFEEWEPLTYFLALVCTGGAKKLSKYSVQFSAPQ